MHCYLINTTLALAYGMSKVGGHKMDQCGCERGAKHKHMGKSAYTRILAPCTKYMIASAAHDDRPVPKI